MKIHVLVLAFATSIVAADAAAVTTAQHDCFVTTCNISRHIGLGPQNTGEGQSFTATTAGTLNTIELALSRSDASNTSEDLILGFHTVSGGLPDTLLAQEVIGWATIADGATSAYIFDFISHGVALTASTRPPSPTPAPATTSEQWDRRAIRTPADPHSFRRMVARPGLPERSTSTSR